MPFYYYSIIYFTGEFPPSSFPSAPKRRWKTENPEIEWVSECECESITIRTWVIFIWFCHDEKLLQLMNLYELRCVAGLQHWMGLNTKAQYKCCIEHCYEGCFYIRILHGVNRERENLFNKIHGIACVLRVWERYVGVDGWHVSWTQLTENCINLYIFFLFVLFAVLPSTQCPSDVKYNERCVRGWIYLHI